MRIAGFRHSAPYHGSRLPPLFLTMLLCACIGGIAASAAFGRPQAAAVRPQQRLTLDEINTRIASLQGRIDSLTALRDQLRQDSSKTTAESSQRGSAQAKKQAEIDDALAKKKTVFDKTNAQYEKATQDSVSIAAKTRDQIAGVHKEIARLDAQVVTLTGELSSLSARREQPGAAAGADNRAIAQLQAQAAGRDSTIRTLQSKISDYTVRRDRLRQDSLQGDAKLAGERARYHAQVQQFDSAIDLFDAATGQAEQTLTKDRTDKEQKIAQVKESIALIARQKTGFEERIARMNTDVSTLTSERQRLAKSAGTALTRYEQLRAPYDKAMSDADAELQRCTKDKPLLQTLRQKLQIDSAVAKTRDLLDKAIQMNAERKKGGKKLVEKRENELESLLAKQDSIARSLPGLRQKEAQIRGSGISQKAVMLDSAIAGIDKKIALAQTQRDKARQNLSVFEQKNPPVQNPSGQRIAQLDTMVASKKKEVIQLMDWSDSLNMLIQETQNTAAALGASARTVSPKIDSLLRTKKNEKSSLLGKRAKIQRDSLQNDAAAMEVLLRIKNDLAGFAAQSAKAQNEIDRNTAERDKAKQSTAAIQEKSRQLQTAALAEKKKNDDLAAAKQQEIMNLSAKSDKLRQDSIALVKKQEEQIKNLSPPPAVLATVLYDLNKEIGALQMQSDSLKRLALAAQDHKNDDARKISQQIAAVGKSIENAQGDIAGLNGQKADALARLNDDKHYYDSLIAIAEKELSAITSRRDNARQDSSNADNNIRKASQKLLSGITDRDIAVAARQKDVTDATAEYNSVRDDSIKTAGKIAAVLQPFQQSIKSIDALMSLREKELTDMNQRLEKAGQDNTEGDKHQKDLLAAAHNEIVKRNASLEQKKNELALAMTVKNQAQKEMDPSQRSYREAVATSTMEIQMHNSSIDKKKKEIARLKNVRDAMVNASKDGTDERLNEDKRHYDSLVNLAEMDLAEMISRRDLARQDSAAAEDVVKQFSQKTNPRVAEREKMIAGLQKEVADATAECNRARDDSIKTAAGSTTANTLQPYELTVRSISAMIEVKGKDLADLQQRRDKASQDSLDESKRQAGLLVAAHNEIVKRSAALEQKKNELIVATASKKEAQKDTASALRDFRDALSTAVMELQVQNGLIDKKKYDMGRLQKVRDAINAQIKDAEKGTSRAVIAPADMAQKRSEEIYLLLGDNRVDDASKLFKQHQQFLKTNLDKDNFEALKITIEQMGGSTQ